METRRIRVFLDSNVILSGLISDRGAPRLILDLLSLGLPMLQGVTGRYNLTEIERNIARRLPEALSVFNEYLPRLDLVFVPVPFVEETESFRGAVDDNDLPVLASAAMARADLFVTGDKRLLGQIAGRSDFPIRSLGPADFLDKVLPDILGGGMPPKGEGR
jgi:putative PIN family toxin of toxin-antitoxin system